LRGSNVQIDKVLGRGGRGRANVWMFGILLKNTLRTSRILAYTMGTEVN